MLLLLEVLLLEVLLLVVLRAESGRDTVGVFNVWDEQAGRRVLFGHVVVSIRSADVGSCLMCQEWWQEARSRPAGTTK